MPVSDREFSGLVGRVNDHGHRIRTLELTDATQAGAARAGARNGARIVAIVSVVGVFIQVATALFFGSHGG